MIHGLLRISNRRPHAVKTVFHNKAGGWEWVTVCVCLYICTDGAKAKMSKTAGTLVVPRKVGALKWASIPYCSTHCTVFFTITHLQLKKNNSFKNVPDAVKTNLKSLSLSTHLLVFYVTPWEVHIKHMCYNQSMMVTTRAQVACTVVKSCELKQPCVPHPLPDTTFS